MAISDLREWMSILEKEGELTKVKVEVDWNQEIGGITRRLFDIGGPAVLFENIKDHKDTLCTRLFTGGVSTFPKYALMLGLPKDTPYKELIKVWRERTRNRIKPVVVERGPCKENILKGDDIDLFQLPVPKWSKNDGGRYISTFAAVVTKDRSSGWENSGVYRAVIHDKHTTTMSVAQGQHIWMHWRSYRRQGENMPLAIAIGGEPLVPVVSAAPVPENVDEWDVIGALRQRPIELVKCETVDLRVPANSEIVLEGELITDVSTFVNDGPFSEFTGHYGGKTQRPVFKVKCITFRDNPIFRGTMTGVPVTEDHIIGSVSHSAIVWDLLEERMTGVTGVNCDPSVGYTNVTVQIDNSYYGQVHQVAANIWGSKISLDVGKNIIVCDQDVDIWDLGRVFWALAYRVDPVRDLITYPGWIHALDPVVHPKDRIGFGGNKGTRLLIDATKPIDRPKSELLLGERFAPVGYPDEETMAMVKERWGNYGIKLS